MKLSIFGYLFYLASFEERKLYFPYDPITDSNGWCKCNANNADNINRPK